MAISWFLGQVNFRRGELAIAQVVNLRFNAQKATTTQVNNLRYKRSGANWGALGVYYGRREKSYGEKFRVQASACSSGKIPTWRLNS